MGDAMFGVSGSVTKSNTSTTGKSQGSEVTSANTRVLDAAQEEELKSLLTQFGLGATQSSGYTREKALADVSGSVKQLFADYSQQIVPKILEQQSGTGGYSGTGTQLLANDAFSRTVAQAATLQTGAIKDYAQLDQGAKTLNLQGVSTVLQGLLGAKKSTIEDSNFNSTTSSKSNGTTTKLSSGFSF